MVAHLLRMRWLLLANSLKRSTWQLVALIIGALYGLGILALAVIGLIALSFAPLEIARTVVILGGAAVVLGWLIIPLVLSGIDQSLDPARLATFPIPMRDLLVGLTLSGVLGVPGLATLLGALATVGTWARYPLAALAAVVCAAIAVVTCVVGSRMIAALSVSIASGRRYRELAGILVFIPIVLAGPILTSIGSGITDAAAVLPTVADAVSWTPVGAVWAVPAEIAAGETGAAALKFVIATATLAAFVLLWRRGLAVALETPPRSTAAHTTRAGLGLLGILPGTPTGAVAARSLTYWVRDPRYARQLIFVPILPVLMYFYSTINGSPGVLNVSGPLVAFVLSVGIYADVSYDGTAFATHVSSGISGVADRTGRVLGLASFALPAVLVITVATVAITSTWQVLPGLLGIVFGVMLSGFGIASVMSARIVFPVVAPGDNPFKAPPGASVSGTLATFVCWGLVTALTLPEVVLAIVSFATGSVVIGVISLIVGVIWGALVTILGIRIGGKTLDRRAPELLTQLTRAA